MAVGAGGLDTVRPMIPALLTAIAALAALAAGPGPEPRRVIFFVADGAGVAHWSAALYSADSLALHAFPVVGLVDPRNTSRPLPESASSASALATGVRTFYSAVGVGPDSQPRLTVLEAAEARGLATGLVTTTLLTDATPAAFAAHVPDRSLAFDIARQMTAAGIDVLLGDGRSAFDPAGRPDSLNLIEDLRRDHVWVESPTELAAAAAADSVRALVGFFAIDREFDTPRRRPSLAEMTAAALLVVDRDPDGFFLLVESEHIDHFGHQNLPLGAVVAEVHELDRAIRVALEYRSRNPATLIVVAGDHETGGLDLSPDSTGALAAAWATTRHTAEMIPVFALGPGAEEFGGLRSGADIGRALHRAVGGADD